MKKKREVKTMLESNYRCLGSVVLPTYSERQCYMHSFDLADPRMKEGYEDYLEVVQGLCRSAGAVRGVAHMTVDEKLVRAGMSQRRPKPHVDGCYKPLLGAWGGGPSWNHYCNDVGTSEVGRMPVIVAASVVGCRAWRGRFEGRPAHDGDLSHISDQLGGGEILVENVGYLLSPDCIHESLPMPFDTERTFLRIALPADFSWEG